ncbi:MAG: gliding motility protein GldL [Bacteroidetes bacterium]|nr:MAG: gliding motility protein GldL [Bacteroidota bacterium]
MSMAYGLGAAIVIVGALFKIMHWPGANEMLILGMGTEAVIFVISAFEPIHQEVDWSLVYPELAGMEPDEKKASKPENKGSISQQLDQMLVEAKVGPELISSLGTGLQSLSDNVKGMSSLASASVATNEYTENVQKASKNLEGVTASYNKAIDAMNSLASISEGTKAYQDQMETINTEIGKLSRNISSLNAVYGNMLSAMGGAKA